MGTVIHDDKHLTLRTMNHVNLHRYIFNEYFLFFFFSHFRLPSTASVCDAGYASLRSTCALLQINMLHLMRLIHSIYEKKRSTNTFRRDEANIGWRWIFDSKLICNECVGINDTQRTTHNVRPPSGTIFQCLRRICWPMLRLSSISIDVKWYIKWDCLQCFGGKHTHAEENYKLSVTQTVNNQRKNRKWFVFSWVAAPNGRRSTIVFGAVHHSRIMKKYKVSE